ncbi:MAG: glycosyltransferase family 4 protein [Acidobacteriota bacterium]
MRILFLSRWYPYPTDNGSKIRIANLLRELCGQHQVTLVSFFSPEKGETVSKFPGPSPDEVYVYPYREFEPHSLRALLGLFGRRPRYIADTYCRELATLIRMTVRKNRPDLVIASQLLMASYYPCFRGIPAIFEEAELGMYLPDRSKASSMWKQKRKKLTWLKLQRFVAHVLKHFEACTVVSEEERRLLVSAVPAFRSVYVVPNSIDTEQCRRVTSKIADSLIFAGSLRYAPNHEAMAWFLREIYPVVKVEVPKVQLKITGDVASRPKLGDPSIVLTGRIPDVHSAVAAAAVSVVPLRSGGGTRLKILESFAIGTPVVATTKAVEGLRVRDGEHLIIADTERQFAQAVIHLLKNPESGRKLAENAFRLVRAQYDSRIVVPRFMELVDQTIACRRERSSIRFTAEKPA